MLLPFLLFMFMSHVHVNHPSRLVLLASQVSVVRQRSIIYFTKDCYLCRSDMFFLLLVVVVVVVVVLLLLLVVVLLLLLTVVCQSVWPKLWIRR